MLVSPWCQGPGSELSLGEGSITNIDDHYISKTLAADFLTVSRTHEMRQKLFFALTVPQGRLVRGKRALALAPTANLHHWYHCTTTQPHSSSPSSLSCFFSKLIMLLIF